jgi:hypothetical protein
VAAKDSHCHRHPSRWFPLEISLITQRDKLNFHSPALHRRDISFAAVRATFAFPPPAAAAAAAGFINMKYSLYDSRAAFPLLFYVSNCNLRGRIFPREHYIVRLGRRLSVI